MICSIWLYCVRIWRGVLTQFGLAVNSPSNNLKTSHNSPSVTLWGFELKLCTLSPSVWSFPRLEYQNGVEGNADFGADPNSPSYPNKRLNTAVVSALMWLRRSVFCIKDIWIVSSWWMTNLSCSSRCSRTRSKCARARRAWEQWSVIVDLHVSWKQSPCWSTTSRRPWLPRTALSHL